MTSVQSFVDQQYHHAEYSTAFPGQACLALKLFSFRPIVSLTTNPYHSPNHSAASPVFLISPSTSAIAQQKAVHQICMPGL